MELKAKDLKPGNYLLDSKDRLCRVETVSTNLVTHPHKIEAPAIKGAITNYPNKPIPLTEECPPIKFGFTEYNGFYIHWDSENKQWFCFVGGKASILSYWHQLQNAYALTGNELEIKKDENTL